MIDDPEPSTLIQAIAMTLFVGAGIAFAIIAATPIPA
jgi:hypothetical protein